MKAAYIIDKSKIEVKEILLPELKPGEALIKVKYAGVCGSDLHVYNGLHPTAKFPIIPGHEFVGELVDIKTDSNLNVKKGDIVVAQPFFSCGMCESCITGHDNVCSKLKVHGVHTDGGFAEYVKVLAKKVYKIPVGVDTRLGALVEPLAVAVHDVRNSKLSIGQTALIIGGGPIGLLIAMVSKLNGASKVVISEINQKRNEFAASLGYTVLNPLDEDYIDKINEITNSKGFDVVFEVSGSKQGTASMTDLSKIGGTIMIVGMASEKYHVDTLNIFSKELLIKGVRIHSQNSFAAAINILENGSINEELTKLISKEFSLDDIKEAYNFALYDKSYFKILVKI